MQSETARLPVEILAIAQGLTEIIEMLEASPVRSARTLDITRPVHRGITAEAQDDSSAPPQAERDPLMEAILSEEAQEEGLFGRALRLITEIGYASSLVLQIKLGVSYRQAVRLVRDLEMLGYVEYAPGFRPRKVRPEAYEAIGALPAT
ncbi:MAG TPA: DNA translocase FtsK [Blastocatellia bacterium]|nr:DNA translocase FtsK [Blastocatellia bacterium]